jgi:hypothetical protein
LRRTTFQRVRLNSGIRIATCGSALAFGKNSTSGFGLQITK